MGGVELGSEESFKDPIGTSEGVKDKPMLSKEVGILLGVELGTEEGFI
jgi:hypothetical protein